MKKILSFCAVLGMLYANAFAGEHKQAAHDATWDYDKHGPEHWGDFSGTCEQGKHQSPVNIIPADSVLLDSTYAIRINEDINTKAKVYDNGHSIKVIPEKGGYVELHGKRFKLIQFHFHGKSEHTIDGRRYDMVAHMVHQADDGTLAVVAVMFEVGDHNPFIQKIIDNIGKTIEIDPQDLLPKDTNHYYHYEGSLTTPPCTEGVQWYILKDTDNISPKQLKRFRRFYEDNERPVQPLNDRVIETK